MLLLITRMLPNQKGDFVWTEGPRFTLNNTGVPRRRTYDEFLEFVFGYAPRNSWVVYFPSQAQTDHRDDDAKADDDDLLFHYGPTLGAGAEHAQTRTSHGGGGPPPSKFFVPFDVFLSLLRVRIPPYAHPATPFAGEISFTPGKYVANRLVSRVSNGMPAASACPPIKKSGRTETRVPFRALY